MAAAGPAQHDVGMWALMGAPAELSSFNSSEASLNLSLFSSWIRSSSEREGFDYLDLAFDTSVPGVPLSFGGYSGSGLWQVEILKSRATGVVVGKGSITLEGVAFYQDFDHGDAGVIRCHGRRSIFERALPRAI